MRFVLLAAVLSVAPMLDGADFWVTKTADTADGACTQFDCSLREAVIAANAATDADTIHLPPGKYTITIPGDGEDHAATGDLDIRSDLTILGDHLELTIADGGGLDRVFHIVYGVDVRFEWLTIQNGSSTGGSGIAVAHSLADVTVERCLVISNEATGFGGGLRLSSGILNVRNTTVTGNTANQGGGLAALSGGALSLAFSTVSNNSSTTISNGMQVAAHTSATIVFESSIIDSGNLGGSACFGGTRSSTGHNIESPSDTCDLDGNGDMVNVSQSSLALQPLAPNGGPTWTFSFGPASVAGNLGGNTDCPSVDQRDAPRSDGFCDIGSYELDAVPPQLIFRDGFESGGVTMW